VAGAFSFKDKAQLAKLTPLELNVYIAELRKRTGWLQGALRKDIEAHLALAVKERDSRRTRA
jgi:hypothetical protein